MQQALNSCCCPLPKTKKTKKTATCIDSGGQPDKVAENKFHLSPSAQTHQHREECKADPGQQRACSETFIERGSTWANKYTIFLQQLQLPSREGDAAPVEPPSAPSCLSPSAQMLESNICPLGRGDGAGRRRRGEGGGVRGAASSHQI